MPNCASSEIPQGETARHIRRFLVIGVLSVLIDLTTYTLLLKSGLNMHVAKGISYIAGTIFGFFGNKFWTFQSPRKSVAEPVVYLVLYAITLGVNMAINWFLFSQLSGKLPPEMAERIASLFGTRYTPARVQELFARGTAVLFATGVTTVLNFLGMRLLAFRAGIRQHRELVRAEND